MTSRPERAIFDRKYFKSSNFRWSLARMIARIFKVKMVRAKNTVFAMRPLDDQGCIDLILGLAKPRRCGARTTDFFSKVDISFPQNAKYLDIGCNDGSVTRQFAAGIAAAEVWGVDINVKTDEEHFIEYDGVHLPFTDYSIDIITTFQTLHHVDNLELIDEIKRVLKPRGYLVIKEHDCKNDEIRKLVDLEHFLYSLIGDAYENPNCRSIEEWDQLFSGLQRIWTFSYPNDPSNIYYAIYQKTD